MKFYLFLGCLFIATMTFILKDNQKPLEEDPAEKIHQIKIQDENIILRNKINRLIQKNHELNEKIREYETITKPLKVTSYTSSKKETPGKGITASGDKVQPGHVAVSRDLHKEGWTFGKKVYVENHGIFEIKDLMANSQKKSLDIYTHKRKDAFEFGKKELKVVLLN